MRSAFSLILAVVVVTAAAADEANDQIVRGAGIVQEHCSRCHAVGPADESTHKDAPPFRFVVQKYPPETLAEALAEGIMVRHPDMPVFVFKPEEIEAIIAYLATLGPPVSGEDLP